MKQIILLILSLVLLGANAKNIDQHTAEKLAKNFYYERINWQQTVEFNSIEISNVITHIYDELTIYYCINFDNGGYVLVSATDNVEPIIGYSFTGSFVKPEKEENVIAWLQQYEKSIAYAIREEIPATNEISKKWLKYLTNNPHTLSVKQAGKEILPMLTTTWNQDIYYNGACPPDPLGPGGRCFAGCVATALGQVMNYFRWPETGTGSYSYNCPGYGTLSADFSSAYYSWDEMGTDLNRANDEIAQLLYHLGISVDMQYGPNGSGMYNHKGAYTLRTYFKYLPSCQYVYRDSTSMDWDSLLVVNLDQKIPMYYAGWSVPNINGHAFVVDGYQEGSYYHFNWGWGGSYDGYFYTNAMNPGGSNFNLAQELIINAVPDTNTYAYPYYCGGADTLNSLDGTIDDGSGPINNYQGDQNCVWLVAPADSINSIDLNFLQFNIAGSDVVSVYSGGNMNSPLFGSYSGSSVPDAITIENDSVCIVFESSTGSANEGWLLSYSVNVQEFCSGLTVLSDESGSFNDGSGSWNYHNSSTCMWRIQPPLNEMIMLSFDSFETENMNDVLKVYDGTSLIGEFSGNVIPSPVYASSGSMFITFTTNASVTGAGWKANYELTGVGIESRELKDQLNVYPVPANNELIVQLKERISIKSIQLFDLYGKLVYEKDLQSKMNDTYRINTNGIESGSYVMKVHAKDTYVSRHIIIQH